MPAQEPAFLTNGLVGYYPFNGDSRDESGNGNDAQIVAGAPTTDRFGRPRSAMFCNPGAGQAGMLTKRQIPGPQVFTVSTWVLGVGTGNPVLFTVEANGGDQRQKDRALYLEGAGGSVFKFYVYPGREEWLQSSRAISSNKWTLLTVTLSGSGQKLYVDGELAGHDPSVTSAEVFNGYWHFGYFPKSGVMDDLRIYNRALSDQEVKSLYEYEIRPPAVPRPQTISWDVVPALQYQQQVTIGVSASSGLPVALSLVSGPATLSGNQLTATGVGDVVLRAVQAGSDAFSSVTSEHTLTVTKAQQALNWPTLASRTFGEPAFPVVVTASSGLPVSLMVTFGKAIVSGSSVTLTGAGSVTLTATQSGDVNRSAVSESKTFAVAKAEQTLTFPTVANRPYTAEPFVPVGTSSSGLMPAFEVLSGPAAVDSGKIRLTGVGSVVLRATQPGNADYNAALPVDRTFTVSQGTQTLTFDPVGSKTFGDAPVTLSATSSAGLAVAFRVLSGPGAVSGNVLTLSGAGTLVLQALQAGTDLYAAASASQNVVVAKAAQTLTFSALADTGYTMSALPLIGSASSGLPVAFRVVSGPATVIGSELRLTGVGVVTVAADQGGNANHLAAPSVTRSFTVNRGAQEITFAPIGDQVLGNPAVTLSATSSSGLSVAFQVISGPATVSGNQLTLLNEGTVVIRASQMGSPIWLSTQVDQTFRIISDQPAFLTNGLVGYYPFNGDSRDESGNGNDAQIVAGAPTTDRFGRPQSAMFCNPGNGQAGMLTRRQIPGPQVFTVSTWVLGVGAGNPVLFTVEANGGDQRQKDRALYLEGAGGSVFKFYVYPGREEWLQSSRAISSNKWTLLTVTLSGSGQKLYVDGELAGHDPSVTSAEVFNGYWHFGYFPKSGVMDDLRIYNRALSDQEVKELYQYEIRNSPIEPGIVALKPMAKDGPLSLDIEAGLGVAIMLETAADLSNWSEVQRLTGQGAGRPVRVIVVPDPNAGVRFWRVRVL